MKISGNTTNQIFTSGGTSVPQPNVEASSKSIVELAFRTFSGQESATTLAMRETSQKIQAQ